jgi:hypothetical protein
MAEEKSRRRRPLDRKARRENKDEKGVIRGLFAAPREGLG